METPINELDKEFKTFISVTDGTKCHNLYDGYIQVLSSRHESRSIWVKLMVTSLPTHDPMTGLEIKYFVEFTVGPRGSVEMGCNVPGPTMQRFFWTPVEAKYV